MGSLSRLSVSRPSVQSVSRSAGRAGAGSLSQSASRPLVQPVSRRARPTATVAPPSETGRRLHRESRPWRPAGSSPLRKTNGAAGFTACCACGAGAGTDGPEQGRAGAERPPPGNGCSAVIPGTDRGVSYKAQAAVNSYDTHCYRARRGLSSYQIWAGTCLTLDPGYVSGIATTSGGQLRPTQRQCQNLPRNDHLFGL